ncbi:MAG TPA: hypothetical protein VN698_08015 [Bacteroidia bacterium]|nr:hypothetical protein [Bacteroidia bacterium]
MTQEDIVRNNKIKHSFYSLIAKSNYELVREHFLDQILFQSTEKCCRGVDFEEAMPNEKDLHDFILNEWKEMFKSLENNTITADYFEINSTKVWTKLPLPKNYCEAVNKFFDETSVLITVTT